MGDHPALHDWRQDGTDRFVRVAGWALFLTVFAFLINNALIVGRGWPGAGAVVSGAGGAGLGWVQLGIYAAAIGLALVLVLARPGRSLRREAALITGINTWLARFAFWAVLLVGVADMVLSMVRVEGWLPLFAGDALTTDLGRPAFRGVWLHLPLIVLALVIASLTRGLGFIWLALLIVVAELAIVISRFVFSYEQAFQSDLVRFWYAALFLFASAYTLVEEGHVRIDVVFAGFSDRTKGAVNALGSLLLGLPFVWTILVIGMSGRSGIINSPILNFEITQSGFGMYVKYWMAAYLGFFAVTMAIQFCAYFMAGVADWRGQPGHVDHSSASFA